MIIRPNQGSIVFCEFITQKFSKHEEQSQEDFEMEKRMLLR